MGNFWANEFDKVIFCIYLLIIIYQTLFWLLTELKCKEYGIIGYEMHFVFYLSAINQRFLTYTNTSIHSTLQLVSSSKEKV